MKKGISERACKIRNNIPQLLCTERSLDININMLKELHHFIHPIINGQGRVFNEYICFIRFFDYIHTPRALYIFDTH